MNPRVSVLIPSYDSGDVLPRAVESVLAQTWTDFELVVIDDGSTDDTTEVVARYTGDKRVKLLRHSETKGPSAARNTGIDGTTGELIALLDADDYWMPEKLEVQVPLFSDAGISVSCAAAIRLFPGGRQVVVRKEPPLRGDDLYEELLFKNPIPTSGIILRRSCLAEVGSFDEALPAVEDRDLLIRLAAGYEFAFVETPLLYHDRSRMDTAVHDPTRMAEGQLGFLRNRERDVPERFRHLLPRLRRASYLRSAKRYYYQESTRECRRDCVRSLRSYAKLDSQALQAALVLARSFLPAPLRGAFRAARNLT